MVEVPVIKAFSHDGQAYGVGDRVRVEPLQAAALARRGLVSLTRGYRTKPMTAAPAAAPEPPKRGRRYRRRDMVPEAS